MAGCSVVYVQILGWNASAVQIIRPGPANCLYASAASCNDEAGYRERLIFLVKQAVLNVGIIVGIFAIYVFKLLILNDWLIPPSPPNELPKTRLNSGF